MSNTTTFDKNDETGEWYWRTESQNDNITADAGGYDSEDAAINGYFSAQGFPSWVPGDKLPEGYRFRDRPEGMPVVIEQETQ